MQVFGDNEPNSRYLILNVWTGDNTAAALDMFKAEVDAGKKAGCNAIKVHASWQLCEPNLGSYDFSQIDARLDYVIKEMRLPVLCTSTLREWSRATAVHLLVLRIFNVI